MSEKDLFDDDASENNPSGNHSDDDVENFSQESVGKKIREKSRTNRSVNTNLLINELIGYGSGLLFFGLGFFIFFGFFDSPGMTPEYRGILSLILFLYGLYRVVTTRGKTNAAKRLARIKKHRSERSAGRYEDL